MVLIFGCVVPLLVTRRKPALSINGPTCSILDGLFWFLVGIVEVIDSESDSTGVVSSGKINPREYLVLITIVETTFR